MYELLFRLRVPAIVRRRGAALLSGQTELHSHTPMIYGALQLRTPPA